MIYLDDKTDSILPYGLKTTPFEVVYKALQAVASTVWPVDAVELRAAVGWGWYLVNAPDKLAEASAGRVFVQNALISEGAPLVKATQTQAELVDLLARWRAYRPTFDALEGLYQPYAATVDVRPITDAATQAVLPVSDIHGAFYVVVTDVDWSRPLTLDEAVLIAERATPMGSRPIALYGFEELTPVMATAANGDAWVYVDSVEIAQDPPEPPVVAVPLSGSMGADYSESVMGYPAERMERGGIGFVGSLRENVIPESGVVEEYVERFDAVTDAIYRMALPNDHSGSYIKTSMNSLRYYAKGTLSNTGITAATYWGYSRQWYHGILTWTDETLGDLTDKITVTPLTASERGKQDVFRIIFIYDGEIAGVHPSDTAESSMAQITNYNYNNGTHSIEFYSDADWFSGTYAGRIQLRYLDGVTKFENLSTFDLVNISSGTLSKATSTDRFNMYNMWNGEVTIKAYY